MNWYPSSVRYFAWLLGPNTGAASKDQLKPSRNAAVLLPRAGDVLRKVKEPCMNQLSGLLSVALAPHYTRTEPIKGTLLRNPSLIIKVLPPKP